MKSITSGNNWEQLLKSCSQQICYRFLGFVIDNKINGTGHWLLKEKLPQAFMQIGWMESDFRNLTAKVWANLDKSNQELWFSKLLLISCMPPSQVALYYNLWCHSSTTVEWNCTQISQDLLFMKIYPPLHLFLGRVGLLRWLCMH